MTTNALTPTPIATNAATIAADRWLSRAVDAGLACCVLVVPWLLGGRHPLGQLILVALAVFVALAWTARACLSAKTAWRLCGAEIILLAAVALVLVQLAPMPDRLLHWLSPRLSEILPLWSSDAADSLNLGRWRQISLVPAATASGLVLLLTYAMLFWTALQRFQEIDDIERFLRWIAWAAVAMATVGLLQLLAGNGKFLWLYDAPLAEASGAAKGSFTNRNHFAHFLALGVGAVIWWIADKQGGLTRRSDTRRQSWSARPGDASLRWLGLAIVVFACLLSLSRGGVSVMLLASVITVVACRRARVIGPRFVAASLAVAVLVAVALGVHGHQAVASRMGELVSGSVESLDPGQRRRIIWTANLHGVADFATLGSGVGSHQWICPMYLDPETLPGQAALSHRIYFTHAENGLLQTTLETGLPGLTLLISGIGLVAYWCIGVMRHATSPRVLAAAGPVVAALAASLVHAMVDFVWHVPACMALLAVLAAAGCRLHRMNAESRDLPARQWSVGPRHAWAAVAVLAVVGSWMIGNRLRPAIASPHWDACRRLARNPLVDNVDSADRVEAVNDSPAIGDPAATGDDHLLEARAKAILAELEELVRLDPTHHEARLLLAGTYLLLFERVQHRESLNAMPLSAVREAAIAARFASRDELNAWLRKAVGEHADYLERARRHARIALRQCPLHGAGYLYLGELSFLDGVPSRETLADAMAQAVRVRPHDGSVLLSAGQEAVMAGSLARAVAFWQRAYRLGPAYRKVIVDRLAGQVCPDDPAADIAFFLDAFDPDLSVVRRLEAVHGSRAEPIELAELRRRHASLARDEARRSSDPAAASRLWMEARLAYVRLDQPDEAINCLREASRHDPNNATTRRRLATCLMEQGLFDEAETHLNWCLARSPNDAALRNAVRQCARARIAARSQEMPVSRPATSQR